MNVSAPAVPVPPHADASTAMPAVAARMPAQRGRSRRRRPRRSPELSFIHVLLLSRALRALPGSPAPLSFAAGLLRGLELRGAGVDARRERQLFVAAVRPALGIGVVREAMRPHARGGLHHAVGLLPASGP